jgi:hypothetical protein
MIDPNEPPYVESLPSGLALRTAMADDVDRLAVFNGLIHGPEIVGMTRRLLLEHPHVTGRDFAFVEDASGKVVSSLCVIPWLWSYAGMPLPVGEMGIVGTLEEYRNRGLVRAQIPLFRQRLHERDCLLSIIQGIPFFYRQFGYEYALPLEATISLELRQVPAGPAHSSGEPAFTFRRATQEDIPVLAKLYSEAAGALTIHAERDAATWRYLLAPYSVPDAMSHQTWLVEDDAAVIGYFRVAEFHFHSELTVDEASALPFDAGLTTLTFLRDLAEKRSEPGIRLNLSADHNLSRLVLAYGGRDRGAYSWQLMIPDIPALLRGIAPALESRLAASMFAGLTRELRISFFREGFTMSFERGRLVKITDMARRPNGWDASMPMQAFTPLVFGWRSLEQLHETYPDLGAWGVTRLLLETLFPPRRTWINTTY